MYIAKNHSWWKVLCKKTTAVGYKVIELAKFTEDMKKEFYLIGESLLGNNAKKNAMRKTFGMSCPQPGHSVEKNYFFISSWSFTYLVFYILSF